MQAVEGNTSAGVSEQEQQLLDVLGAFEGKRQGVEGGPRGSPEGAGGGAAAAAAPGAGCRTARVQRCSADRFSRPSWGHRQSACLSLPCPADAHFNQDAGGAGGAAGQRSLLQAMVG